MTGDDAAQQREREADKLEHHLDELQDHIDQASKTAAARRDDVALSDSGPAEDAAPEPLGSIDPTTTSPNETAEAQPGTDTPSDDSDASDSSDDDASSGEDDDEAVGGPTPGHAAGGDD